MKLMTRKVVGALLFSAAIALFAATPPDGRRWWSYIEALANDDIKGRDTGSAKPCVPAGVKPSFWN